jgi:hypothetical protein
MTVHRDYTPVPVKLLEELGEIGVHVTVAGREAQAGDVIELMCGARVCLMEKITHEQFREASKLYPHWGAMLDRNPSLVTWRVSID